MLSEVGDPKITRDLPTRSRWEIALAAASLEPLVLQGRRSRGSRFRIPGELRAREPSRSIFKDSGVSESAFLSIRTTSFFGILSAATSSPSWWSRRRMSYAQKSSTAPESSNKAQNSVV